MRIYFSGQFLFEKAETEIVLRFGAIDQINAKRKLHLSVIAGKSQRDIETLAPLIRALLPKECMHAKAMKQR
jgi:hypothetical protein